MLWEVLHDIITLPNNREQELRTFSAAMTPRYTRLFEALSALNLDHMLFPTSIALNIRKDRLPCLSYVIRYSYKNHHVPNHNR
jgi:hypothetical protein